MSDTRLHPSALVRILIYIGGALALALGVIGIFLPGLPTTPFVLLAAACFMRASPRAHAWLLAHRVFGPPLQEWEIHRSVPRRVKGIALLMMVVSVSGSVWYFSHLPWVQIAIVACAVAGAIAIAMIPSRR
jgi:uncharacterized membrane protein YbaN (DUF454 family)